jgi:hypothetical protein
MKIKLKLPDLSANQHPSVTLIYHLNLGWVLKSKGRRNKLGREDVTYYSKFKQVIKLTP